jgi:hypothetical protein
MHKPIEPGCLCLSLDPDFPGQCIAQSFSAQGEVIRCAGSKFLLRENAWKVRFDGFSAHLPARLLMRIDGGDELVEQEQEEELTA